MRLAAAKQASDGDNFVFVRGQVDPGAAWVQRNVLDFKDGRALLRVADEPAAKLAANAAVPGLMTELADRLAALESWSPDDIQATVKATAKDLEVKPGALMFPLRALATGVAQYDERPFPATAVVTLGGIAQVNDNRVV